MHRLAGTARDYAWGSATAIPELLGRAATGEPLAELWFGAHPSGPSVSEDDGEPLTRIIAADPEGTLGADVIARFGQELPYLVKLIAAARPLSLQVHPNVGQARAGYATEDEAGVALDAPERSYKDRNHKPELVFALTPFEAMCGFRAPRRAAELFADLDAPLATAVSALLRADPSPSGVCAAFTSLLSPDTRPSADDVDALAKACEKRLANGSTSPRADATVVLLQDAYPGDPGVVASLLLNPVSLQPGEALFVPAGGVHAYLNGLAVEIMASSDNVLRAGLTGKHIDVPALLDTVDYVAAPPIRPAPEVFHGSTRVFYAPVDDFELSVTSLEDDAAHPLPGRGPRILICLDGEVRVSSVMESVALERGQAVFVGASEGALTVKGGGTLVQADVP